MVFVCSEYYSCGPVNAILLESSQVESSGDIFSLLTALAIISIISFGPIILHSSLPVVLTAVSVSGVEGLNSGTD